MHVGMSKPKKHANKFCEANIGPRIKQLLPYNPT